MTQCEKILRHMKDFGSITALEAMNEYGIMRLASRISDMRNEGIAIVSKTVVVKNRHGEKRCVKQYSLEDVR